MALLEMAAAQGHAYAMNVLGEFHRGWEEHDQAVQWYAKSAEAGLPSAMFSLGCCLDGQGGQPDYPAAADWYRRAADAGVGEAAYNLTSMYRVGRGRACQIVPEPATSSLHFSPLFLRLVGISRRGEHHLPGPGERRHAQQAAGATLDAQGRRERLRQGVWEPRQWYIRGSSLCPRGWACGGGRRARNVSWGHGGTRHAPRCLERRYVLVAEGREGRV